MKGSGQNADVRIEIEVNQSGEYEYAYVHRCGGLEVNRSYLSHMAGLCGAESRGNCSKCSIKMSLVIGEIELPIAIPFFC
jgi:hypothetical protein